MQDAPVIPVIVLTDVAHAVPMARALVAGGVRMLEVTLRTPQALACIEAIARDVPEDGFTELKFFPAMQAGGPAMLKAWSGPFFDIRFCPTGGVTLGNAPDLLALPNVVCVGGSWLVPVDALAQGDWERITRLARDTQKLQGI